MSFLSNSIKVAGEILFKEDETTLSLKSQNVISEQLKPIPYKELARDALKISLFGDYSKLEDENNGLTIHQKRIYYFTHFPCFKERENYEVSNIDAKETEEGSEESNKKALRIKKIIIKVFDWINFIIFILIGWVWFIGYNFALLLTEFPARFLENILLHKCRENESSLFKALFVLTKLARLLLCTLTSPIQNIKDVLRLNKEKYPKARIALFILSGLLSAACITFSFIIFSWVFLKIFGTSLATYIVPRLTTYSVRSRLVIETAVNALKTFIPNLLEHGADIVNACIVCVREKRKLFAAIKVSSVCNGEVISYQSVQQNFGESFEFIQQGLGLNPKVQRNKKSRKFFRGSRKQSSTVVEESRFVKTSSPKPE